VFLLCGLWHEGSWKFIAWGLMHGSLLALERVGFGSWLAKRPRAVRHLYALLMIVTSCVFVRAASLPQAIRFLGTLFGLHSGHAAGPGIGNHLNLLFLLALGAGILGCVPILPALRKWHEQLSVRLGGRLVS
jgi:alginate O-acetyltransferase complex protein AlgI